MPDLDIDAIESIRHDMYVGDQLHMVAKVKDVEALLAEIERARDEALSLREEREDYRKAVREKDDEIERLRRIEAAAREYLGCRAEGADQCSLREVKRIYELRAALDAALGGGK